MSVHFPTPNPLVPVIPVDAAELTRQLVSQGWPREAAEWQVRTICEKQRAEEAAAPSTADTADALARQLNMSLADAQSLVLSWNEHGAAEGSIKTALTGTPAARGKVQQAIAQFDERAERAR